MNDRVKGSLKVTRAFGAGFLKQVGNHFKILCLAPVRIVVLKQLAAFMASYYILQCLCFQCNVEIDWLVRFEIQYLDCIRSFLDLSSFKSIVLIRVAFV